MKSLLFCMFLLGAAAAESFGGEARSVVLKDTPPGEARLTGCLLIDLFGDTTGAQGPALERQTGSGAVAGEKSSWLAAGLSIAVPGAGEFYAESYWKSAAFFAVEVAAWAFAYAYDHKGDRQTDFFQNYANAHWSVVQYAQWTATQVQQAGLDASSYHLFIPGTSGQPPWDQVNWSELNRMERDFSLTGPGSYYSHSLPTYGSQQYFELIGKYEQFSQGWDDANLGLPADYATIKANLSARFFYYSGQRGLANTYYTRASTAVAVAIINHVLSAIDAAWTAGLYNKRVRAEMGLMNVPGNRGMEQIPVASVSYSF